MTTVTLATDPTQHSGLCVTGTEPWDLPKLLTGLKHELASHPMLSCVETLRVKGPKALSREQRAFWLSYQDLAKSPLPGPEPKPLDTDAVLSALEKATPQLSSLDEDLEKAEHSLVCQQGPVGIFAKRGPIRSLALPDWCRMAIAINTKAKSWEVMATDHSIIHLAQLLPATTQSPKDWTGHRYRAKRSGLPDVRTLHLVTNSLIANLAPEREK